LNVIHKQSFYLQKKQYLMQNSTTKKGILLMNLGSPASTAVADVRRYLKEFLMDERVIDIPKFPRILLVKGIIAPFRAPRSAKAYRRIWTDEGSPLVVLTQQLRDAVAAKTDLPVAVAMRYGMLTPAVGFSDLLAQNADLEEVILVPLYPHYAMSSYETAVEHAIEQHREGGYRFKLTVVPPFYNNAHYINALAESMRPYLAQGYDHLLFSYHGIPERHVLKSDPTKNHCLTKGCCEINNEAAHAVCYAHQTKVTTMLVTAQLGLEKGSFNQSFQSRLGKKWLKPYTDKRLAELPKEGVKRLLVVCPAFVSDCLETLEEMAIEGKETFLENGGTSFTYIPCLNTSPLWVDALLNLVNFTINLTEKTHQTAVLA
jgi:protoporphyrin/coproporphyrin ferrochelatase